MSVQKEMQTVFDGKSKDLLQECIHCGFCLPACPTYTLNGNEADSPRGRLYLMDALSHGRLDTSESLVRHLDLCLLCRACETACPSGVEFGSLMEVVKEGLLPTREKRHPALTKLENSVTSHERLSGLMKVGRLYQKTGLHWLTTNTFLRHLVPAAMRSGNESLPTIPKKRFGKDKTQLFSARDEKRGTVALFTGCVMDHLFPHVHEATVRIFTWNGFDVIVPGKQSCCGALHAHSGDIPTADRLSKEQLQLFGEIEADAIVVNSAGCGAQLKEYDRFASADDEALETATKVRDLTEFLASIELRPPEANLEMQIVYDDPCHLLHAQGISTEPREIISRIPGVTLLSLPESDQCCGSAGSYSLTESKMSQAILDRKMEHISAAGADAIITANPGCQIQLAWGVRGNGLKFEVLHIAELLDKSYRLNPDYAAL